MTTRRWIVVVLVALLLCSAAPCEAPSTLTEEDYGTLVDCARSPSGYFAVSGDGELLRFDERTLDLVRRRSTDVPLVRVTAVDDDIAAVARDGRILQVDPVTLESELLHTVAGEPLWLGTRRHGGSASLVVIVLKPGARDSPELRVDQRPGAFAVHDLATGREHTLDVRPDAALVDRSNRLWVGSDNGEWGGSLCVLDLASGEVDLPRDDRGGPNAAVYGFSELPDARVLVFGGMEHRGLRTRYLYEASPQGLERVWPALDPDTGKTLEGAPGPDGPINAILPGQGMLFAVSGNEIFEVDRSLTEWKLIITLPTRRSIRRGSVVGAWLDASTASRYELTLASPDEGWFRLRDGRLVERP